MVKDRVRRLRRGAAVLLLLLTALLAVPFLLTTQLVRLVLGQVLPANNPSVGSAALSLSGTLVVHDLALHDAGSVAPQPLLTVREIEWAFGWTELLSRRIRRIHAEDVTVYVRPDGPTPLSLLAPFFQRSQSGSPAKSNRGSLPLWIDTLNVQGRVHTESAKGFVSANADLPLALQLTMSGGRRDSSMQFRVSIGDVRQLPEKMPEKSTTAGPEPVPTTDAAFALRAEAEILSVSGGTRVVVHRLAARRAALTLAIDTLRQYVAKLPPELQGRLETNLGTLWASGELDLPRPARSKRLMGSLTFAGLRVRLEGSSQVTLNFDDLASAAKIDTPLPPGPGTAITVERLQVGNTKAAIESDTLRRYAPQLPADLHGPFDTNLGALDVSGLIGSGTEDALSFSGNIRLRDLSVYSPAGGKHAFALERFTAAGSVESRLDRWAPAALKVRDGVMQWATLSYRTHALYNFTASWHIEGGRLIADRCAAQIFDGHVSGSQTLDLVTYAVPRCDLQIQSINMHKALADLSPEHLDVEGNASGFLHLLPNTEGELSGYVDLAFDGPGILRIGEIEEVKQMLVGNFGLDLANLAMHDLKQYPFREGRLYLESLGKNSQLKVKFVRQPRTEADVTPPHREIINGTEVWVGSLVVPTVDMTIPITGKSLAEILSIISGIRPLTEGVSGQPGK
ncbi:MAG TPA: hypothetical protein VGX03_30345 [Candidatus Binatia bacterium]|nr:hypothetical protein [Candidatus Binatia bacterium]